jgi:hypothetical protein
MNWCIWCDARVKPQHMGVHLWSHGVIHSPRRQGFTNGNGRPPELLVKRPEPAAMQAAEAPRPPTLWDALEEG